MSEINVLFVIPLAISLVAAYITTKFNDDLAYLGMVIAIVSSIVGLVLAPWQLQLFLSVLVLVGVRLLWKPNNSNITSEEFTEEFTEKSRGQNSVTRSPEKMRSPSSETDGKILRKYRGVSYEVPVASEPATSQKISGKYRGQPWTSNNDSKGMESQKSSPSGLKYRGVRWTQEDAP